MENLSSIKVAKRVCWEVAETARPVDILQYSLSVIGRFNTEIFAIFGVPETRQRLNSNISINKDLLQLEAHNDMQVVGHLICFDTYQAGLDFVQSSGKGCNIHVGKLLWKCFSYGSILTLPVWLGTSNGILPEAGLILVSSHRCAAGNKRTHKC